MENDYKTKNDRIGEYEANLRAAERDIENALGSVCSLGGEPIGEVRRALGKVLEKVQEELRRTYWLYDNPGIREG